jgi:hypothetical protein
MTDAQTPLDMRKSGEPGLRSLRTPGGPGLRIDSRTPGEPGLA